MLHPLPPERQEVVDNKRNPRSWPGEQHQADRIDHEDSCASDFTHEEYKILNEHTYYGDPLLPVEEDHFRLANINVDNLAPWKDEVKDGRLFSDLNKFEIGVALFQEVGVNWSAVPRKHQWMERCKGYFEPGSIKASFGYNKHDITGSARQWGGTGVISIGKITYFSMGTGTDKKGLGRWTWARYRGKQGIVFRVVSFYQPCNSKGPTTVHEQQRCRLQAIKDDRPVRRAFREDFKAELADWINLGDQIVVGGDVNESVFHQTIIGIFQEHGMRNIIFESTHRTSQRKHTLCQRTIAW